jgi:hypothetical protein
MVGESDFSGEQWLAARFHNDGPDGRRMQAELRNNGLTRAEQAAGTVTAEAEVNVKVMAIMLIELWERLRGYDKLAVAEAQVQSSDPTFYLSRGHDYTRSDDIIV